MGLSTDVFNAIWSRLQADSAMSARLKGERCSGSTARAC